MFVNHFCLAIFRYSMVVHFPLEYVLPFLWNMCYHPCPPNFLDCAVLGWMKIFTFWAPSPPLKASGLRYDFHPHHGHQKKFNTQKHEALCQTRQNPQLLRY